MKKTLFVIILALSVFTSCKKGSSSSTPYHFTATIDGVTQTFNVTPMATRVNYGGRIIISIRGFNGTTPANMQTLEVDWNNILHNDTITFHTGTLSDNDPSYAISGFYEQSPDSVQYTSGADLKYSPVGTNDPNIHQLNIVITALDSNTVKGTFSGDFYFMGDMSATKKTITNGDFYVPWKK